MPLPSSGQLSFSQLSSEFLDTGSVSYSELYRNNVLVPNITQNSAIPTSGQMSLSNFYGTQREIGNFNAWNNIGASAFYTTVGFDSSGNGYVTYGQQGSGGSLIAKVNSRGQSSYIKSAVSAGGFSRAWWASKALSDGRIALAGNSGTTNRPYVTLINASGQLSWSFTGSSSSGSLYGVDVDSSSNIYAAGAMRSNFRSGNAGLLQKFDVNGNILWSNHIQMFGYPSNSGSDFMTGVVVDSSGNSYVCGTLVIFINTQYRNKHYVAKFDTNGNILWQKYLQVSDTLSSEYSWGIDLDSSNNVYVYGQYFDASNNPGVFKLDTNGNLIWQIKLVAPTGPRYTTLYNFLRVDRVNGAVYFLTYNSQHIPIPHIFKFDLNGNLIWKRTINIPGWTLQVTHLALPSTGDKYAIGGYVAGAPIIIELPADGTVIKNYSVNAGALQLTLEYTENTGTVQNSALSIFNASATMTPQFDPQSSVSETITDYSGASMNWGPLA